ncbi:ClpXP protease specificity-enhancing factor SspB [Commensalibacter nepenthis]|uniref:ClpXP protease specificity-enhancing factor SspB n=1 Tax=Commensalibacter nepenthis TaxID=3043872 RepID=A0ABT6Q4Y1_9PROT|nr:ClpXP protease specificity-enhancing factor SspB [Commensalibacter sp. TBRC 10068]MDI2111956.1 ClpXP protease specificity-enhancing factor SspB [Commensalibacter sp. TBRC 10068]
MTHSDGFGENPPTNLLPYQGWIESAYRQVTINALKHVALNGMPGNHSFYLTFLTAYPGVSIPARLKAQYPEEITIVLQHQFWDLTIDEQKHIVSVGLSFGGVTSTLIIPSGAITAFSDPEAKLLFTFSPLPLPVSAISTSLIKEHTDTNVEALPTSDIPDTQEAPVISLDAFRKKHE